jgi:hypothetical protein
LHRCQCGTRTSAGRCTGNSILARRHQCGSRGSWGIRRCRRTDTCIDDIGLPEPALTPFRGATDIAFAPNGRIFICDGYANARILEYTVDGKKLREWGSAVPKLNFQVLRRRMATLAQRKGSVKDIQAHLRHSKADTTANEYMQELPESVGRMVESMYEELTHNQAAASADLLPNATNEDGSPAAICMKEMVGTRRLELLTSTVSR